VPFSCFSDIPSLSFPHKFLKNNVMAAPASSPGKTFLIIGLVTLIAYFTIFSWVESRRRKNGPWEITFTQIDDSPALLVNHLKLGLTNVVVIFLQATVTNQQPTIIQFEHGQVAPFTLPYGKCVFLDTLFLPGTVTCEMFGHEIQILPRTMTIDHVEHPWQPGEKILLTNRPSATLPAN